MKHGRYNRMYEYDPVKMRALAGNVDVKSTKPDNKVYNFLKGSDFYPRLIKTLKVSTNDSDITKKHWSRIILFNGKVYSSDGQSCIHQSILAYLGLHEGEDFPLKYFREWGSTDDTSTPFLCLHQHYEQKELIYFSESYNQNSNYLAKLKKNFTKEIKFLERIGCELIDRSWSGMVPLR